MANFRYNSDTLGSFIQNNINMFLPFQVGGQNNSQKFSFVFCFCIIKLMSWHIS